MGERPPDECLETHSTKSGGQQSRWYLWDQALDPKQPCVVPKMAVGEGAVALERLAAGDAPVEGAPHLAPAGDAEVESGADALSGQGEAVAGRIADEKHAVLRCPAEAVRDPVALVADRVAAEVISQAD